MEEKQVAVRWFFDERGGYIVSDDLFDWVFALKLADSATEVFQILFESHNKLLEVPKILQLITPNILFRTTIIPQMLCRTS